MSAVEIRPSCLRDASYVFANLRPLDCHEAFCQIDHRVKTHEVAWWSIQIGESWVAYLKGRPVMVFGYMPMNVAAVSIWAMGTKHATRVVPAVTRHVVLDVIPSLIERGYHSMEARSIIEHEQAHRWMESTGAVRSGEPFPYGRDGELFQLFRWTRPSYERIRRRYTDTTPTESSK